MVDWIWTIDQASVPFLVWLQGFQNDGLTAAMRFFSYLGTEYFYLLLLPFLYWTISKRWGILVTFSLVFSTYLMGVFKWTFNLPRPPSPPVEKLWHETSPSFFSGHAATAMAVWGALATLIRRTWFWALAAALIFFIGFSRLYLGVHYPADVIAGWLAGGLVAWAVLTGDARLAPKLQAWPALKILLIAFFVSLLMVFLHPRLIQENQWPAPNAVQLGGLMFGIVAGLVWDVKSLHFQVQGSWGQKALRMLLGLVVILFFYLGPKLIIDAMNVTSYPVVQSMRFVRYTLVGFAVSGLAPWLFQRLRLTV